MINHKTTCLFSKHMISTMKLTQRIFKNATKDIDITYPQFMLLKTIEKKQQMTIGDIVRISGIDQGNVSNMCKKLEKGLVTKTTESFG